VVVVLAAAGCRYPATEVVVALASDAPPVRTLTIHAVAYNAL
jgi:hypothetical protein